MDLRVMSPSGFQDGRRASAAFLTTLPRCGASEEAGIFRSSRMARRGEPYDSTRSRGSASFADSIERREYSSSAARCVASSWSAGQSQ